MGQWVTRSYLKKIVNQAYLNQEKKKFFLFKIRLISVRKLHNMKKS